LIEVRDQEIVVKPAEGFLALEGFLGKALPRREERKRAMVGAAARSTKRA